MELVLLKDGTTVEVQGGLIKLNNTFMKHFVLYSTLGNSVFLSPPPPHVNIPKTLSVTATNWSKSKCVHINANQVK